jgi:mono/diheme cytochrome c family protein
MRWWKSGTALLLLAGSLGILGVSAAAQGKAEKVDAAAIYKLRCAMCHGNTGESKLPGMSFADGQWKHGHDVKEIAAVIRDGVEGTAMLPFRKKLKDAEIASLARYVRAFDPRLKSDGVQ